jgi:hypothetical protein
MVLRYYTMIMTRKMVLARTMFVLGLGVPGGMFSTATGFQLERRSDHLITISMNDVSVNGIGANGDFNQSNGDEREEVKNQFEPESKVELLPVSHGGPHDSERGEFEIDPRLEGSGIGRENTSGEGNSNIFREANTIGINGKFVINKLQQSESESSQLQRKHEQSLISKQPIQSKNGMNKEQSKAPMSMTEEAGLQRKHSLQQGAPGIDDNQVDDNQIEDNHSLLNDSGVIEAREVVVQSKEAVGESKEAIGPSTDPVGIFDFHKISGQTPGQTHAGFGVFPTGSGVFPTASGVLHAGSGVFQTGSGVLHAGSGVFHNTGSAVHSDANGLRTLHKMMSKHSLSDHSLQFESEDISSENENEHGEYDIVGEFGGAGGAHWGELEGGLVGGLTGNYRHNQFAGGKLIKGATGVKRVPTMPDYLSWQTLEKKSESHSFGNRKLSDNKGNYIDSTTTSPQKSLKKSLKKPLNSPRTNGHATNINNDSNLPSRSMVNPTGLSISHLNGAYGSPILPPNNNANGSPILPPNNNANGSPILPPNQNQNRPPILPRQSQTELVPLLPHTQLLPDRTQAALEALQNLQTTLYKAPPRVSQRLLELLRNTLHESAAMQSQHSELKL